MNGKTAACLAGRMGGEHDVKESNPTRVCVQMAAGLVVGAGGSKRRDAVLAGGGGSAERYKSGRREGLAGVVGVIHLLEGRERKRSERPEPHPESRRPAFTEC